LSKSLMNLISNAVESMQDDGEIKILTENIYINTSIKGYDEVKEGDYIHIIISDTGIGIPKDDIERIFEPFFTKKVMGRSGSGLGMAVVWGTVKDHNGYIEIESTMGKGTTIHIYFPATRETDTPDELSIEINALMGNGEKILVVDDVQIQRDIASNILKKLKYDVIPVASGEEAVDYLTNNDCDLLLLDMIMEPGMDGLETYKHILEIHPMQKAIIASGFSETQQVKDALKLGAGAYLKKPYMIESIGVAVQKEIER